MISPVLTALLIPLGALAIAAPLFALTIRPDANPASSSGGTSTTAASGRGASGAITTASQNGQATAATPATTVAQYVDQRRGVIDQVARTPYTADASYAIGTIPQDTPPLVPGQDVELVQTNCSVCHATTFISSQPPLPGSTWHDEVYKMKEKYGATFISDETAGKIIAYLTAHYTPETHAP